MKSLYPEQIPELRDLCVLDVRPADERRGPLGFIPGSIMLRSDRDLRTLPSIDPARCRLVLYCQSGRRSSELITAVEQRFGVPTYNLEGGILGWGGAGLPTVGDVATEAASSDPAFFAHLRSCFIGESVETMLEHDLDFDPLELFREVEQYVRAQHQPTPRELLLDLIDHMALASRRMGTSLESIATNTQWAYESIASLDEHALSGFPASLA